MTWKERGRERKIQFELVVATSGLRGAARVWFSPRLIHSQPAPCKPEVTCYDFGTLRSPDLRSWGQRERDGKKEGERKVQLERVVTRRYFWSAWCRSGVIQFQIDPLPACTTQTRSDMLRLWDLRHLISRSVMWRSYWSSKWILWFSKGLISYVKNNLIPPPPPPPCFQFFSMLTSCL